MIIGNENIFALDFSSINSYRTGFFQIWINGNCLGENEETFIKPNLNALKRVKNLTGDLKFDVNNVSVQKLFNAILNDETISDQTLLGFGETFDKYILRVFIFESNVFFLWSLVTNKNIGLENGFTDPKCSIVSLPFFNNVLDECAEIIGI
jgi:hypothetical protein